MAFNRVFNMKYRIGILILWLFAPLVHAQDITTGLVAWYQMEGNMLDASGNAYNGTFTSTRTGLDRFSNANTFGFHPSLTDDFISLSTNSALVPTQYTVSLWFKLVDYNSNGSFDGDTLISAYPRYAITALPDNSSGLAFELETGTTKITLRGANAVPIENSTDNGWHMATMTWDGAILSAYVDGLLEDQISLTTAPNAASLARIYPNYEGLLDDIRIYNRALTAADVDALYQYLLFPDFTATSSVGNPGLSVTFTDVSTSLNTLTSYTWDFGDGTTGSGASVSHTYNSVGTYDVSLTISDGTRSRKYVQKNYVTISPTPPPSESIVSAEYFFDQDPGHGNGTPVSFTGGDSVDITFSATVDGLNPGFHYLYLRSKSSGGKWSTYFGGPFYILQAPQSQPQESSQITSAEYFFNNDPGIGNGTPISFSPFDTVDVVATLDITSLQPGFHRAFIRVRDNLGRWSTYDGSLFYIQQAAQTQPPVATQVTAAEFFFDTDPGIGNGTTISLSATASEIDEAIAVASTGLALGPHTLSIRVKDNVGRWSIYQTQAFEVSDTSPDLVVSNTTISPDTVESGGSISYKFTLSNNGTADIISTTALFNYYFSDDAILSENDTLIFSESRTLDLTTGASFEDSVSFSVPASAGLSDYYVFIEADVENIILESNDFANNRDSASVYVAPVPQVISVSPTIGEIGSQVTIDGFNFSPEISENTVLFNTVPATIDSASNTQLKVTVPSGLPLGLVDVTVNTLGIASTLAGAFEVNDPNLFFITDTLIFTDIGTFVDDGGPNGNYSNNAFFTSTIYPLTNGQQIQLTFNEFVLEPCCDNLTIYNGEDVTAPQIGIFSDTIGTITADNPAGALTLVFSSNGSVAQTGWQASISTVSGTPFPFIEFIEPAAGLVGDTVFISGVNFNDTIENNEVLFNNTVASLIGGSSTGLEAIVPAIDLGPADVVINVNGLSDTLFAGFEVITNENPIISSVIPSSGAVGTIATVTGQNFSSIAANNIVSFDTAFAEVLNATNTNLEVLVPDPGFLGSVDVFVTVNGRSDTLLSGFEVTPAPTYTVTDTTVYGVQMKKVAGNINEDFNFHNQESWYLHGIVRVVNGATLQIEEGVQIYAMPYENGGNPASGLAVEQGSFINARGTASNPIVFTSDKELNNTAAKGDWAGIAICGQAPVNDQSFNLPVFESPFGGEITNDISGTFQYVRIEYAGVIVSADIESNGLTLAGVGSGTNINHVQSYKAGDDGIEIFGGTVNLKYIVSTDPTDDAIDYAFGWTGKGQYWIAQQYGGNSGIEGDNNNLNPTVTPISFPQVANMTILGDGDEIGLKIRNGSKALFHNSIISNFLDGITVNAGDESASHITSGDLDLTNSVLDNLNNYNVPSALNSISTNFIESSPLIDDFVGSRGVTQDPSSLDGGVFFESNSFAGAVENTLTDWTVGWVRQQDGNIREQQLSQNLVAHFPFDLNTDDITGGNPSLFNETVIFGNDRVNRVNLAYDFEAVGGGLVGEVASHPTGEASITYSMWIFPTGDVIDEQVLLHFGSNISNERSALTLIQNGNGYSIRYNGGNNNFDFGGTVLFPFRWHHIAFTKDGTNVAFYVNGQSVATGAVSSGQNILPGTNGGVPVAVGYFNETFSNVFNGRMDNLKIYDGSLQPVEIEALYSSESTFSLNNRKQTLYTSQNIVVDGIIDDAWNSTSATGVLNKVQNPTTAEDLSATFKTLWDQDNFYVLIEITDDIAFTDNSGNTFEDDGVEVYIDANNGKSFSYESNDYQFRVSRNRTVIEGNNAELLPNTAFADEEVTGGYVYELAFSWADLGITPGNGKEMGLDIHVMDDDDGGARDNKVTWNDLVDAAFNNTQVFGTTSLGGGPIASVVTLIDENFDNCIPGNFVEFNSAADLISCFTDSTGFVSFNGFNIGAGESWLVTPPIDFSTANYLMEFDYQTEFTGPQPEWVYSTDYPGSGNPANYIWTLLTDPTTEIRSVNGTLRSTGPLSIAPANQVAYVALRYFSNGPASGESYRIRLDNLKIYPESSGEPTITSFSPTAGTVGSQVTISGNGFGNVSADATVTFGTSEATILSISDTEVVVEAPSQVANDYTISIDILGNSISTTDQFELLPSITGLSSESGVVNDEITMTGTGFSTIAGDMSVTFGATSATINAISQTELSFVVPDITSGNYTVELTVNEKTSTSTATFTINEASSDTVPPSLSNLNYPEAVVNTNPVNIQFNLTDDSELAFVQVYYTVGSEDIFQVNSFGDAVFNGSQYDFSIPGTAIDDLGTQFIILTEDVAGNRLQSDLYFISRSITNSTIMNTNKTGTTVAAYNLFTVPVQRVSVSSSIQNRLGSYDRTEWRLFTWNPGATSYTEFPGFTNLQAGRGYFLIKTNATTIPYSGQTVAGNYSISGSGGFNLIGNPYPFQINTSQVEGYTGDFLKFNGNFFRGTTLNPFEGAFIELPSTRELTFRTGSNARIRKENNWLWKTDMKIETKHGWQHVARVGMNEDSDDTKDMHDLSPLPSLSDEQLMPSVLFIRNGIELATDVVGVKDQEVWNITMEDVLEGEQVQLSWENDNISGALYLEDKSNGTIVDMISSNQYRFTYTGQQLQIHYGVPMQTTNLEIKSGNPVPNPTNGNATISVYNLSGNEEVTVEITSVDGRIMDSYTPHVSGQLNVFELKMENMPAGMYIYKVLIENESSQQVLNGHINKLK